MRASELREHLEGLRLRYHRAELLARDPLQMAHRFSEQDDVEVVALLAAAFASGNIKSILAVLEAILATVGPHPARWLREHSPGELQDRFAGIGHRWVRSDDMAILMARLGGALREHGTLGHLWKHVDDASEPTVLPALGRFVEAILGQPVEPLSPRVRTVERASGAVTTLAGVDSILLTSPERGSACKRMCLFLRWVVRERDGVDLGLWTRDVSPARLVMPMDTHVLKKARALHFTRRTIADRKTAEEVTARFRKVCPEDPCRYDFAIVHSAIDELRGRRP